MKINSSLNEDIAIQIENLTVRYRVPGEKISTIKEYLDRIFTRKLRYKEFVALKNLNLTIKKGERIGIIGHNGAGKSTLLKAIAHVIKPTEGSVEVFGSIAPLLELGAGFDQELSGIRNIYLNGSFLGKSKKYLDSVRDDIIDFAELGEFINYPVKNYSSGMRAKLGFAIATQVDSDILLVDEVFGVGDENFKRKSKDKMLKMINSGKTVIIVSHDMTQMVDLTDRVLWMDNGEIIEDGPPQEVCDKYCAYMFERQNIVVEHRAARPVRRKERKERKQEADDKTAKSKNNFYKKTGIFDRFLNDSEMIDELLKDRRVLRKIYSDETIIEDILESEGALDFIVENDDLLYDIFQNDSVQMKAAENPYLFADFEQRAYKIIGKVDECIYYGESGLLYVKGWNLPIDAYSDVKIFLGDELLGEANIHLRRTGANKSNANPLDKYPGWEFLGEVSLKGEVNEITAVVLHHNEVLARNTAVIEIQAGKLPSTLEYKYSENVSEVTCWDMYQKYILGSFSLLSFQRKNAYNRLLEEQVGIGCFYKKNYCSEGGEFGFRLVTNALGLRGPADTNAQYAVIGGGIGLGLGVDEKNVWYSNEVFSSNWINLCYACEPNQLLRLMDRHLMKGYKLKHAILLYEASFWSVGVSTTPTAGNIIAGLQSEEALTKERESFFEFYNKVCEGFFRIVKVNNEVKLLNCQYGLFDFKKYMQKCDEVIRNWSDYLEKFERITVLRIPNTAYLYAFEGQDDGFRELKENQDYGWELFINNFKDYKNMNFIEVKDFDLQDFLYTPGFLSEKGNAKLRKWIIDSISK